jgi:hypothetical protein
VSQSREPFSELVDYESGELSAAEAAELEERLFAAAAAGQAADAAFVDKISLIGQYLLPRGGFDIGSSRARVDALIAAGLRVQLVDPEPAEIVEIPAVADDTEIFVTLLRMDVRGYDSVDAVIQKPDGTELKTFRDIGCDPETGYVYAVCEAPLARISAKQRHVVTRVIGTRDGVEHTLGVFQSLMGR